MAFDLHTLYELHYLMITLGKVFCQKKTPNCAACPLAPSCDYARFNGPRMQGASEEQKEILRQKNAEKQRKLEELEAEQVKERLHKEEEARSGLQVNLHVPSAQISKPKKVLRPAWGEGGAMKCGRVMPKWLCARPRSDRSRSPAGQSRLLFLASLSKDLQATMVSKPLPFQSDFDKLTAGLRGLASSIPQEVIMIDLDADDHPALTLYDRGEKRKASPESPFTPSKALKSSSLDLPHSSPYSLLETPSKETVIQQPAMAGPITPFTEKWKDTLFSAKKRSRIDEEGQLECDMNEANCMVDAVIARLEAEEDQKLISSLEALQNTFTPPLEGAAMARCCHIERVLRILKAEELSRSSRDDKEASKVDLSLSAALEILTLPSNFVPDSSSETVIKAKYRELCVVLHPDKNKHPNASDCFTALSMAADVVSSRSKLPVYHGAVFDPNDDDDPAFWVDEQGEINIPRAAKVLNEESGPPGQDPRWSQALVLFNASPSSVPLHVASKSRLHKSALPLPLDAVKRLVGPRSSSWPSSCPSYESQDGVTVKGIGGRVDLGSPYLLMFVKQRGESSLVVMRPSEVEQALTRHERGERGEVDEAGLLALLLLPAWVTLQGSFPLNATYFQTNEVMMDSSYITKPMLVPWEEVKKLALKSNGDDGDDPAKVQLPWRSIYFGFSASSICAKMGFAEVANLFHRSSLCVRAFDWGTGSHVILPSFALP